MQQNSTFYCERFDLLSKVCTCWHLSASSKPTCYCTKLVLAAAVGVVSCAVIPRRCDCTVSKVPSTNVPTQLNSGLASCFWRQKVTRPRHHSVGSSLIPIHSVALADAYCLPYEG